MNRLKELRKRKRLTLDEIAKEVNINRGTYNNYENEKTTPTPKTWQALADYFNVSVPYLQGAYSKEEILKVLQESYKKQYYQGGMLPNDLFLFCSIENYLIASGIIPYNIPKTDHLLTKEQIEDFNFWKNHFNGIFNTISIEWLINKPSLNANEDDIKQALDEAINKMIFDAISNITNDLIETDNKLNKRWSFLENHAYYKETGDYYPDGHPVYETYYDFDN